MNFEPSEAVTQRVEQLHAFMAEHVIPNEQVFRDELAQADNRFATPPVVERLKEKAQAAGLWNLFKPIAHGGELSNLDYAPLAEIMGRVWWAPEVFNCNAPDTGNMETLMLFGTEEQKERWLTPLLAGDIRSGFCMTEPDVASSDATNVRCAITREGNEFVINGTKWYTTGGMRESCELLIVMGKTDPDNPNRHAQQSMVLVPKNTPGVRIVRHVTTFGYDDAPFGEATITFENVRVPPENILLGEGRGFDVAQGRLGPGRIRTTFGKKLSEHQSVREDIAKCWCDIEQARLLTLKAADTVDKHGAKAAWSLISAIKIVAPTMAQTVIDRAIQVHGAAGLTADFPLAELFNYARQIRFADGPDQVHMMALGRRLVKTHHEESTDS